MGNPWSGKQLHHRSCPTAVKVESSKSCVHQDPGEKSNDPKSNWVSPIFRLLRVSCRGEGMPGAHCEAKTLAAAVLGSTHWCEPFQRLPLAALYNLYPPVLGCWSGLLCPPPEDLPDSGIEPSSLRSPELAGECNGISLLFYFAVL